MCFPRTFFEEDVLVGLVSVRSVVSWGVSTSVLASCGPLAFQRVKAPVPVTPDASSTMALVNPHRVPSAGMWFEGWYTRVTTDIPGESFAVIAGTHFSSDASRNVDAPGYFALLYQPSAGAPLQVHEAFPQATRMVDGNGNPISSDPRPQGEPDFQWQAPGFGHFSDREIQIELPGGMRLDARFGKALPWDTDGWGPEGWLSVFKFFPLHWFVHSLASEASFVLDVPAERGGLGRREGRGRAHMEKNWGASFPESWIWLQGENAKGDAHIAVAGGKAPLLGALIPQAYLAGYHSESHKLTFKPHDLGTVYQTNIDACAGLFELTARNPRHTLKVKAQAPRATFSKLSVPTEQGFQKGASESFSARIEIEAFRHSVVGGLLGREELLERTVFENAALEFGGGYDCQGE